MQQCFRGGAGRSLVDPLAVGIDNREVGCSQAALVAAGGRNQQLQGSAAQHDAVVAAGAERPAAAVEEPTDLAQRFDLRAPGLVSSWLGHGSSMQMPDEVRQ